MNSIDLTRTPWLQWQIERALDDIGTYAEAWFMGRTDNVLTVIGWDNEVHGPLTAYVWFNQEEERFQVIGVSVKALH